MANSLRAKISKLRHDGNISDSEYQELIKKLDGHNKQIREEIKKELWELPNEYSEKLHKIAYEKGRADAISEYKKKIEFEYKWLLDCKVFESNVDIAFNTLISYAEKMKEQKNGESKEDM